MRKIKHLIQRINAIVPLAKCNTHDDDYDRIEWFDARLLPTAEELEAIDPIPYLPETREAKKKADIDTVMPDWATVTAKADALQNVPDIKLFLKELARVVYWLAKNKAE